MEVIIGDTDATKVSKRWKSHYFNDGVWRNTAFGSSEDTYKNLLACNDLRHEIDAAIGNKSWTHLLCDGCNEYVDRAVSISDGDNSTYLCENCLKTALAMIRGKT